MLQGENFLQTLTDNKDIHIGYSDKDIVIIDSIQKFAEISSAHVSMSAITICTSGKVQGTISGQRIELHQNQVAVIPQNVIVTDLMVSPDFNLKAMFLSNNIIQSFLCEKMGVWNKIMYMHELHILTMADEDIQLYIRFYDLLQSFFNKPADMPFRTDVIQSLLRGAVLGICGLLSRMAPSMVCEQEPASSNTHFQRFLELLHSEHSKRHTVEYYANELCISPKYLSFLCKKQSGKTANEWITEHTMEEIRYYLKQTDLSFKQICDQLGFPNPSFFGKYVKDHFGMTPGQFRWGGK